MQEVLTLKINIESNSIYEMKMKFKYVQQRNLGSLEAWLILGQKRSLDHLVVPEYYKHIQRLRNRPQGPPTVKIGRI